MPVAIEYFGCRGRDTAGVSARTERPEESVIIHRILLPNFACRADSSFRIISIHPCSGRGWSMVHQNFQGGKYMRHVNFVSRGKQVGSLLFGFIGLVLFALGLVAPGLRAQQPTGPNDIP